MTTRSSKRADDMDIDVDTDDEDDDGDEDADGDEDGDEDVDGTDDEGNDEDSGDDADPEVIVAIPKLEVEGDKEVRYDFFAPAISLTVLPAYNISSYKCLFR